MANNPASVVSLLELAMGALHPSRSGSALFPRLRYFDPGWHRAGRPSDVVALVDELAADRVSVTLVNVDQLESRRVIVQVGGYAEHRFVAVLTFTMKRYSQSPTLAWPW